MRRLLPIMLIVTGLLMILPGMVMAAPAGDGTIEGKIINATPGGGSVADQEVTLKTYRNDAEQAPTTARTDAEGNFIFKGLATGADYSYTVTLTYQEAEYDGDRLTFGNGETSKSLEMKVYDSTTEDKAIKVTTAHTIIYVEKGKLRVSEYLMVENNSDYSYIGPRELSPGVRETLAFALPVKAAGLQVGASLMSCCIYNNDKGFVDSMAVLPGSKELTYTYDIAYKDTEYGFSSKVNYPTANYDLLIQSPVEVTGTRLMQAQPVTIKETKFNRFTGGNLAPGDVVAAQISGLPKPPNQSILLWVLLSLAILGSGFAFYYLRNQRTLKPVKVGYASREEALLVELARLDDNFDSGKMARGTYRKIRTQKKAELAAVMQQSRSRRRG